MDQPEAAVRASDRERKATVRLLRGQLREGRLSDVTFVRLLSRALDARRRGDLDAVVAGLPRRRPLARLAPVYQWVKALLPRLVPRWPAGRGQAEFGELALPPVPGRYLIGRSDDVDLRLDDISVSRHHAVIQYVDGRWMVTDQGSRNGTWINGWRLPGPAPVNVGDLLYVGCCRFVIVDKGVAARRPSEAVPAFRA
jgi:hypothetical protein